MSAIVGNSISVNGSDQQSFIIKLMLQQECKCKAEKRVTAHTHTLHASKVAVSILFVIGFAKFIVCSGMGAA